ncbi:MAG: hypothetical protein WCW84_07640 [Sulfurimonas sp.]|jgi:hypothetical protein
MRGFYGVEEERGTVPFVVSLSNHEDTLRQAQDEREEGDDFYDDDDEDDEREWCD